jgi:hypothetical protein
MHRPTLGVPGWKLLRTDIWRQVHHNHHECFSAYLIRLRPSTNSQRFNGRLSVHTPMPTRDRLWWERQICVLFVYGHEVVSSYAKLGSRRWPPAVDGRGQLARVACSHDSMPEMWTVAHDRARSASLLTIA